MPLHSHSFWWETLGWKDHSLSENFITVVDSSAKIL